MPEPLSGASGGAAAYFHGAGYRSTLLFLGTARCCSVPYVYVYVYTQPHIGWCCFLSGFLLGQFYSEDLYVLAHAGVRPVEQEPGSALQVQGHHSYDRYCQIAL